MLWQNASARTVATATPVGVARPAELLEGADRGGALALLAERREVVQPEQRVRRLVHRVQVERPRPGQHLPARAAGPARPGCRRSGRRSGATARRSGRRTRPAPRPPGVPARPWGRTPLSRRSSWSGGRLDVAVHHLAARVHAGVGAPGADDVDRRRPAAPSPAPRSARPGRCAAPAAPPTRGSRCRRRRGRSAGARAPVFHRRDSPTRYWPVQPAIILVSENHADFLADEFGRYRRDYDIHAVGSASAAADLAHEIHANGGQVALFVSESVLPDSDVLEAFHLLAAGRAHRPPAGRRALGALPRRRRAAAARAWPRASTTRSC